MSKAEKLLARFLRLPKDFTIDELTKLLAIWGYELSNKGNTSGSRVAYINKKTKDIIRLHKPHPRKEIGTATMKDLYNHLNDIKLLK